jgi:hypothetical protein
MTIFSVDCLQESEGNREYSPFAACFQRKASKLSAHNVAGVLKPPQTWTLLTKIWRFFMIVRPI